MRFPFSRSVAALKLQAASSAALLQAHTSSVPPCHTHGNISVLRGQFLAECSSRWQPWVSRRSFAVSPLQPQHVRRWRGVATMAKGGKQQKRKQDDSERLSYSSSCAI